MAVVCLNDEGLAAPADDCADGAGSLIGFIANGERAGLSYLNLRTGKFTDLDDFIPSYNPVNIGERAVSIVGLADSSAVITANYVGRSLTRLQTVTLDRDDHDLLARPAQVLQQNDDLLIGLHPDDAAAPGMLMRLSLDEFGQEQNTPEVLSLPGWSQDMVLDETGDFLYVSYVNRAFISRIDLTAWAEVETDRVGLTGPCRDDLDNNGDGLVDQADYGCRFGTDESSAPDVPAEADDVVLVDPTGALPQCMNGVDDNGDGLTDYPDDPMCRAQADSIENTEAPLLSRLALTPDGDFLYATNARDYTVVVIDTVTMSRVDVNAEGMPGANALLRRLGYEDIQLQDYESILDIDIVSVSTESEDETPGTQFIAYITSATGRVIMVDVTDPDGTPVHRFRDGDSSDSSIPLPPQLYEGEELIELSGGRRKDFPSFGEYIANKPVPDAGADAKANYGIQVVGEPRIVRNESWKITHQGALIERLVPLGQFNISSEAVVFETVENPYCDAGVEVGDQLIVTAPSGMNCATAEFEAVAFTISGVTAHALTLEPSTGQVFEAVEGSEDSPVGTPVTVDDLACLDTAVSYEIRVPKGVYSVVGSISGDLHPWVNGAAGACVQDETLEPRFTQGRLEEWVLKSGESIDLCPMSDDLADDYFEHPDAGSFGEPLPAGFGYFENHAFNVRMLPGCQESEVPGEYVMADTPLDAQWRFLMNSAFEIQALGSFGTPRRLHWNAREKRVFVVDSGLERVVSITPSSETVSRKDYY